MPYVVKAINTETIDNGAVATGAPPGASNQLYVYDRGFDGSLLTQYDDRIALGELFWDDVKVAASAGQILGASNKPEWGTFIGDLQVLWFDNVVVEQVFFMVQMPHSWAEWTDVKPHVHWVPKSDGSVGQDVSWGLEYSWANVSDVFGSGTLIYSDTNAFGDTSLVANKHYITSFGTISPAGYDSSMLACRLFRDATGVGGTDDYGDDAGLLEFDIHIRKNALGSIAEYPSQ